jgi:two-component system sensor histidine kinase UhpB
MRKELRDEGSRSGRLRPRGHRRLSLYTRVLLVNVTVLTFAFALIAATPARVSFPRGVEEAAGLVGGLVAMVVANAVLLRLSFGPLGELVQRMRTIDLLVPGQRIPVAGGVEVRTVIEGFNEMLDRLEAERQRSVRHGLEVQDEERRRIAQELHDEIGQRLTAILLLLGQAVGRAPEELRPNLRDARETARATIDEIGRLVWQLRPGVLEDLGLLNALDALAQSLEDTSGVPIDRTIGRSVPELDATSQVAIYRVAQEALTNALRHGEAERVHLSLLTLDGSVRLEVEDDGTGFEVDRVEDWGIRGMRERALLVGALFDVDAATGIGTRVTLELPTGTGG